jgi:hypothetical protein
MNEQNRQITGSLCGQRQFKIDTKKVWITPIAIK